MKDKRDGRHEFVKNQKWMGGKPKNQQPQFDAICDCGKRISEREAEMNDGMCNVCWKNLGGV